MSKDAERFVSRPALTPLEADRVAALAYRIVIETNNSLHAYPQCAGLRNSMDAASKIIKLTGRGLYYGQPRAEFSSGMRAAQQAQEETAAGEWDE